MKKIVLSISTIIFVGAIAAGLTGAYFGDTETSTGNTFTAGALDLKVDNECHYFHYNPEHPEAIDDEGDSMFGYVDMGCPTGPRDEEGEGNPLWVTEWSETDLEDGVHKFFYFGDIKPGDRGEDTISLHVYDNDAWGRFSIATSSDDDNSCTEPETDAEPNCDPDGEGELDNYIRMRAWLDQGRIPGFQNVQPSTTTLGEYVTFNIDPEEGDNKHQEGEPFLRGEGQTIDSFFDIFTEIDLRGLTGPAYAAATEDEAPLCPEASEDGHNNYGPCHGLAEDGRMVGSTTYYIGWMWEFNPQAGNDAQTDSLGGDMIFEVVQHRNNPNPWTPAP
ncbi:CalY family protein [bacterium]|nr:CalY family protein [bacterium]